MVGGGVLAIRLFSSASAATPLVEPAATSARRTFGGCLTSKNGSTFLAGRTDGAATFS